MYLFQKKLNLKMEGGFLMYETERFRNEIFKISVLIIVFS